MRLALLEFKAKITSDNFGSSFLFFFGAVACQSPSWLVEMMRLALLEFKAKITSDTFGAMSSWNDI